MVRRSAAVQEERRCTTSRSRAARVEHAKRRCCTLGALEQRTSVRWALCGGEASVQRQGTGELRHALHEQRNRQQWLLREGEPSAARTLKGRPSRRPSPRSRWRPLSKATRFPCRARAGSVLLQGWLRACWGCGRSCQRAPGTRRASRDCRDVSPAKRSCSLLLLFPHTPGILCNLPWICPIATGQLHGRLAYTDERWCRLPPARTRNRMSSAGKLAPDGDALQCRPQPRTSNSRTSAS